MKTVDERKAQLLARLAELNARLHKIEDTLEEPVDKDFEERAVEREGDEVLESLGKVELNEVHMIEAALHRVEAGEYGICIDCGEPISEERLDLVPATPKCQKCA